MVSDGTGEIVRIVGHIIVPSWLPFESRTFRSNIPARRSQLRQRDHRLYPLKIIKTYLLPSATAKLCQSRQMSDSLMRIVVARRPGAAGRQGGAAGARGSRRGLIKLTSHFDSCNCGPIHSGLAFGCPTGLFSILMGIL